MTLPVITDRLILRRFTFADVADILALVFQPSVARVTSGNIDATEAGILRYIELQNSYRPFEKDKVFDLAIERKENGKVIVTVADTGTGIPDEIKDKILEPFFTTKEVGKGTGLGLSISYGIIKDYDGMIEVESEVGRGSTLRIAFPACGED